MEKYTFDRRCRDGVASLLRRGLREMGFLGRCSLCYRLVPVILGISC